MNELNLLGVEALDAAELERIDGGNTTGVWQDPENPENGGCIPDPLADAMRKLGGY